MTTIISAAIAAAKSEKVLKFGMLILTILNFKLNILNLRLEMGDRKFFMNISGFFLEMKLSNRLSIHAELLSFCRINFIELFENSYRVYRYRASSL